MNVFTYFSKAAADDFRFAIRLLARKPRFTALITVVMAAGIGLSLFLLTFINTVTFKDLPFKDGASLMQISSSRLDNNAVGALNLHDLHEIRASIKGLSEPGAYRDLSVNVTGREGSRRYAAVATEPNLFRLTRTQPLLGRDFTEADNVKGAELVVVIGYDIWQNQYGGDAGIVNQLMRINGQSHKIIGVMPKGYYFPARAELWVPMLEDVSKSSHGEGGDYYGLAHIDAGVAVADINRQLAVIMQRIAASYPDTNRGVGAYVATLKMWRNGGNSAAILYSMYIVAMLITFLAATNVGNLLLSRIIERGKETAVRVALGAPRSRLICLLLWESIIVCCLGGVIGLLLLAWGLQVIQSIIPSFFLDGAPFWWQFGIDAYSLKLFIVFVIGTIVVTGLYPAWKYSGAEINSVLRDGTRGAVGKKTGRLNRLLVNTEIFLSLTILIVAAVLIVAAYQSTKVDYGAATDNILTAQVQLPVSSYDSADKQLQFISTLEARLAGSADISEVMITTVLPGEVAINPSVAVEGVEYIDGVSNSYPTANYIKLMPDTLSKLGVELKAGRYFDTSDNGLDKKTVIVTESFAKAYFADKSPLDSRVRIIDPQKHEADWLTVIGVVEHTMQGAPNTPVGNLGSIFRPLTQSPAVLLTVAMRMATDRAAVTRTLRTTLASIDAELPAFAVETYAKKTDRNIGPTLFITAIFSVFGVVAVILAGSGIYGVMSNIVNQNRQEIGVKRALGAWEARIRNEYLIAALKRLLWGGVPGFIVGCAMGFALSRVFGMGNAVLVVIALVMLIIIGFVVVMATYIPTMRALKMQPNEALHCD